MIDPNILEKARKYAAHQDQIDVLREFRQQFHFPKHKDGSDIIYFCGNSLGLQSTNAEKYIQEVIDSWRRRSVEGHFTGDHAWIDYHNELAPMMASLVGAKSTEIAMMNTLTVNLHLMMVTFYRPTKKRYKILIDYNPFPSDRYAIDSHLKSRDIDPKNAIIELKPGNGEIVTKEDIDQTMDEYGDEIALVLMAGINYYTGQFYPLQHITHKAKEYGCKVGFDLAHAAGNVPLYLHDMQVDFAVWCTYKYLNAGPGNLAGCFIHEQHHEKPELHRYAGWWGFRKDERFLMKDNFIPEPTAEGWILSNPPVICLAGIKSALELFAQSGFDNLVKKSKELTGFLERMIMQINDQKINIISPSDPGQRGCQLSIRVKNSGKSLFDRLRDHGVIGDWREPDVIRIAPVPLYNSFGDVIRFAEILEACLQE